MNPKPYHLQFTAMKKLFGFFKQLFLSEIDRLLCFNGGENFSSPIFISPAYFFNLVFHQVVTSHQGNLFRKKTSGFHIILTKETPNLFGNASQKFFND